MTHHTFGNDEARRRVLVIAGMHRSGTSALAGALHQLGAALPKHLIHPNDNNPRGYFESEVLYPLHDQLFSDAGCAWNQLKGPTSDWFASEAADQWVNRLVDVAKQEFPDAALLVFKDPRICRLLPIWKRVFEKLEIEAHYLLPVRNPFDVARSLQIASDVPKASGLLLWLDYFLHAERDTRDERRGFIHYDELTVDWQSEITRACSQAGVSLPLPDRTTQAGIDDFLMQGAAPRSHGDRAKSPDAHPWIETAYHEALRGCADENPDPAVLDEICESLELAEAALGASVASMEYQLQVERGRRRVLEENISSLEERLEARVNERRELRDRLSQRRDEAHALSKTVELLMRWVLDRTREADKPASAELRAALAAIEKAEPAAIPQIASTAALLADKNVQLANHERERADRAALVVEAGKRVATAEGELARLQRVAAERAREDEDQRHTLQGLREQLQRAEDDLRVERVRAASTAAEQERLSRELAEQLRRSGSNWFARVLKGMGL